MTRFNHYFANHFSACRLLAEAYDHCRNRDVRIYLVPGEMEFVGVTDGIDCWIAPVRAELFSVNIQRIIQDIHAGLDPSPMRRSARKQRHKLLSAAPIPQPSTTRGRRALLA
jgi:hypothetical protein